MTATATQRWRRWQATALEARQRHRREQSGVAARKYRATMARAWAARGDDVACWAVAWPSGGGAG
ncbi:hypothetical protein E2562_030234 [Oryza meyeriana var. granulata]|uniref:Uncharacterized protein n=1 Tax=Oryza meyeriana var. granulata TaxID=110450 RepID=A0A6G1D888_9ORYZ|nr:hypothetical protein E2562_030234 [Oryza meyeriana var. granulata]